jgi:hypothetical protein
MKISIAARAIPPVSPVSPIGAVLRGLIAGTAGAWAQRLFFQFTRRLAPRSPPDVFDPPEPAQKEELGTETVARRLIEGLFVRRLSERWKHRAGTLVHYGFGAAWGMLYGIARDSFPIAAGAAGLGLFSGTVWLVGDQLLLPIAKLAAGPQRYPIALHAYTLLAHVAYGLGVAAAYATFGALDRHGRAVRLLRYGRR